MAKPTYIILQDQPSIDDYGQYVYDVENQIAVSGLNTIDPTDDLYTKQNIGFSAADFMYDPLSFGTGQIKFEGYPLFVASPAGANDNVFWSDGHMNIWFFDGANVTESDLDSYSSIGDLISREGFQPFVDAPWGNSGEINTITNTVLGYGGWSSGWAQQTWSGWFNDYFIGGENWFSDYNEDAWNNEPAGCLTWRCDTHPVIGFGETDHLTFLGANNPFSNWESYLLDMYFNPEEYDGSEPSDYFYIVVENSAEFTWPITGNYNGIHRTRVWYRYPKLDILEAWRTGQPVVQEKSCNRIYGSMGLGNPQEAFAPISGNDGECYNTLQTWGTWWAAVEDDDVTDGTVLCTGYWSSPIRPVINVNINPPEISAYETPPYEKFFNLGGKSINEYGQDTYLTFGDESLRGYNIYFSENFTDIEDYPLLANLVYDDWRPISNVFIGDDYLTATYLQRYYEYESYDYLFSSAPNIVNLYATIQDGENLSAIVSDMFGQEYYQKILDIYQNNIGLSDSFTVEDLLSVDNNYLSQKLKFFVVDWDWKEDEMDIKDIIFPYTDEELFALQSDNTFYVRDVFNSDGSPNVLQHQYNSPGIKTIKMIVMSTVTNSYNEELVLVLKSLDVRIFLGLDDVYIEDFADVGGPDFTFIPWPITSPIISGLSDKSQYIKSLKYIVDNNLFTDNQLIDRNFARKSLENDEYGDYLGNSDIEQVRYFKSGNFDMAYLLGIQSSYENINLGTYYSYFPFDKYQGFGRWDGITKKYPAESSITEIFINDYNDQTLISNCLFEINGGETDGRTIRDSSGNGNKGVLIGDFSVKKETKETDIRRDSVMKTPTKGSGDGAI